MITEDQAQVIDFLSSSSAHGGLDVDRIETHTAIVFLAGTRAWKLKRAVKFDYLDFSTTARRRAMCEAEVRLNRRTAPKMYRGVTPVTREADGSLALGGSGTPVDWVIEMARFDQDALFDRLAASGQLDVALMPRLASAIARFHSAAEQRRDHGGAAGMGWVIEGNADGFSEFGAGVFEPAVCDRVTNAARRELARQGALLDARRDAGFVRHCHGDLHLRNIVLIDDDPTLFDGIEFNDELACTDVLYDLAFLLMDLWRRGLPRHANAVWNGYLAEAVDVEGIALMPLFLSCRAAVRAKTSATAARFQSDEAKAGALQQLARDYLTMAGRLLQPPEPRLIAIGGLSGSGKSTLAVAVAPSVGPVPGAVVLRSDDIRKRLCGVAPLDRLGPEGYTQEVSSRVYAAILERASLALRARHTVIADAVFATLEDRQSIERLARDASVRFDGLWLDAPDSTLIDRTKTRRMDPSDADESVIRMQRARELGPIEWHRLDSSPAMEQVLGNAMTLIEDRATRPAVGDTRDWSLGQVDR
jgi:aminoglycoside phosphotransferase family enzyme/predicted kinase